MASVFGSDERFVTLNKKEFHELLDEKGSSAMRQSTYTSVSTFTRYQESKGAPTELENMEKRTARGIAQHFL